MLPRTDLLQGSLDLLILKSLLLGPLPDKDAAGRVECVPPGGVLAGLAGTH